MLENEHDIVHQAQHGSSEHFGQLYDHYIAPIYRFVFLKTNNKEEAEDIVQDVFVSAWKHIGQFEHTGFPFSSWLYRIARNKVIDYYRTQRVSVAIDHIDEDRLKLDDALARNFDLSLDVAHLKTFMRLLGDDQQNVLIMRFVEELSYQEIAGVLGKNEGTVRLIQHRAIKNLKKIIERHGTSFSQA